MKKTIAILFISLLLTSCFKSEKTEMPPSIQPLFSNNTGLYDKIKDNQITVEQYLDLNSKFYDEFLKRNTAKKLPSGLIYEVMQIGKGNSPKIGSRVKVNYAAFLIDGTIVDDSTKRGIETIELKRAIKGWQEGIPLMKTGSKFRFVVPANLAYNQNSDGKIPGNSSLIFEIELLEIVRQGL